MNNDAVVANGFDEAYVGFLRRANSPTIAIYDYQTCVEILMRDEEYSRDEAVHFMEEHLLLYDEGDSTPGFAHWKDEYDDEDKFEG